VLVSALLLGLLGLVGVAPAGAQNTAEQSDEWDIWCWVNRERIKGGVAPLPMARLLRDNVARPYSSTLASRNSTYLEHRSDLWSATSRAIAGVDFAGENIGYSHTFYTVQSLYDAWMQSSTHRSNIRSGRWEYIGIGITHGGSRRWGVQNFASTNRTDVTTVYPPGQRFIDVCDGNAFFNDINWMYDQGITTGTVYPRYKMYKPTTTVSRSAMAAFLYRTISPGTSTAPPTCSLTPYPYSDGGRNPFAGEICWLASQGINDFNPTTPGLFSPGAVISRARVVDWLYRASDRGCDDPQNTTPEDCFTPPADVSFTDVPTTNAQFAAVEWASAAGVSRGYPDRTFLPSWSITREAMAAMLQRYANR